MNKKTSNPRKNINTLLTLNNILTQNNGVNSSLHQNSNSIDIDCNLILRATLKGTSTLS